jgi:hypothetical protein
LEQQLVGSTRKYVSLGFLSVGASCILASFFGVSDEICPVRQTPL